MRLMIAGFSHETNSFSPVPTPLSRFCPDGETLPCGDAAIAHFRGTSTVVGGYLDVAAEAGAEIVVPVVALAPPSGKVARDAFETISAMIVDTAAAGGFDGLLLDLHGAMVVEGIEDGEGELLRRIRAVQPDVPIAVALDMHANVFDPMVKLSTVISGYHLYPHTDEADSGRRAASALLRTIAGEVRPTMAWGGAPMLPHTMSQATHVEPNKSLQQLASRWEQEGRALSASLFVGFALSDVSDAGLSAVVVTDNDPAAAQAMVDELLAAAWAQREPFRFDIEPLADSVARAKEMADGQGPIFLIDHHDNCASGGSMDTTKVLAEIIRQDLDEAAFFGIFDPAAVETAFAAGIGATIDIEIGGKFELPALGQPNPPLTVRATVKTLSAGSFTSRGPSDYGLRIHMGRTAVIDTGKVEIVLLSRHAEPCSIDMLTTVGIDPRRRKFVAIKSRHHWRSDLGTIAADSVNCAGLGVCTSNYSELPFANVRRPIYPLDPDTSFPRN
jgi:microcystin degradation protein MlrC